MSGQGVVVALRIDGKDVSGRNDETILQVARENQIQIYTLCYLEGLSGWGACRLCLVEVKGSRRLLPACVTRVSDGMEVSTNTPRLQAYRQKRDMLRYLVARPSAWAVRRRPRVVVGS